MNLHQVVTTAPRFELLSSVPEDYPIFGMSSKTKMLLGMIAYTVENGEKKWFFCLGADKVFADRHYDHRNDLIVALEEDGIELYVDIPPVS